MKKYLDEFNRREVYSQAFHLMFYGYGDVDVVHKWALFSRNNDDICISYFTDKSNKWKKFISLERKYIPQYIYPTKVYELEGLVLQYPPAPAFDPNWTKKKKNR